MTYFEWNNLLGDQLFKPERKDQEVFLFLSKEQVIEAGWKASGEPGAFQPDYEDGKVLDDEHIWRNFLNCVRSGPAGAGGQGVPFVERAHNCLTMWQNLPRGEVLGSRVVSRDGKRILLRYPLHLPYLLMFTMPFGSNGTVVNRAGYYDTLNLWMEANVLLPANGKLTGNILGAIGSGSGWGRMWQYMGEWSSSDCQGNSGVVCNRADRWPAWPYVGWPLAQCLLPPRCIYALKKLFIKKNLVPGLRVRPEDMRAWLISDAKELGLPTLTRTSLSGVGSLGDSIVEIVLNILRTWEGSTNDTPQRNSTDRTDRRAEETRRGETMARLLPFIQLNVANEEVKWHHRIHIRVPLPDDLTLSGLDYTPTACTTATPDWSSPVTGLPLDSLPIVLTDPANKWRTVCRPADVQLFVLARRYGLPHWAPADELEQGTDLLLLCTEGTKAECVRAWGRTFSPGSTFQELHYTGLPGTSCLFRLRNPDGACPGISELAPATQARIVAEGGLSWVARTYLSALPPAFRLLNMEPDFPVHLRYAKGGQVELSRNEQDTAKWYLPEGVQENEPFTLFVPGHELANQGLQYQLTQPGEAPCLPRLQRGPYNDDLHLFADEQCAAQETVFYNGYQLETGHLQLKSTAPVWTVPPDWYRNAGQTMLTSIRAQAGPYFSIFNPAAGNGLHEGEEPGQGNDALLHLLTAKGQLTMADFSKAYDVLVMNQDRDEESLPSTTEKRGALRLYAQMGFGDYQYSNGGEKITVLEPTLLALPTRDAAMRRMLLTGARTPALIEKVRSYIQDSTCGCRLLVIGPAASNTNLILPDTMVLEAPALNKPEADAKFGALARSCGIRFISYEAKVPVELVLFSGSLRRYADSLLPDPHVVRDGWRKKKFIPATLSWEDLAEGDESYRSGNHLLEYILNDYDRRCVWWKDGQSHAVDKSWGRYLALREAREIVLTIQDGSFAVPAAAPLPDLLARALVLLSGKAPALEVIPWKDRPTRFNVYRQPGAGLLIHRLAASLRQQ